MTGSRPNPLVSVVIVTRNRRDELLQSIGSVFDQTYKPLEVIVVDNGSGDGSADAIRSMHPEVMVVSLPENVGCPSGRNVGFSFCKGKYVYCLDDDGWLDSGALAAAVGRAEADGRIGVVMSQIREVDETGAARLRESRGPEYRDTFGGGCCLLRRRVLDEVGAYPDDFFRQAEESDLSLRLIDAGYKIFYDPSSVMFHRRSPSERNDSEIAFYTLRNTTKTSLRLWPVPWCIAQPMLNCCRIIGLAMRTRDGRLIARFLGALARELWDIPNTRRPVARTSYRKYRALRRRRRVSSEFEGLPLRGCPSEMAAKDVSLP